MDFQVSICIKHTNRPRREEVTERAQRRREKEREREREKERDRERQSEKLAAASCTQTENPFECVGPALVVRLTTWLILNGYTFGKELLNYWKQVPKERYRLRVLCRISNKIIGYHSISLDIIGLFCRVSDNIIHDIQCLTKFTATKTSKCSCRCSSKSPCSAGTRPKTKLANLSDQIWEFSTPSAPYGNSISLCFIHPHQAQ